MARSCILSFSFLAMVLPVPAADPVVETIDVAVLERAMRGPAEPAALVPASHRETQLTISRHDRDDFQDRQLYLFVDGESWGKIRYGQSITQTVAPGHHRVRAFNTMLSRTLELDLKPAEHARLRCGNGMPTAGWLMFIFLHATYLLVRLERED